VVVAPDSSLGVQIGGLRPTAYSDSHQELIKTIDKNVRAENLEQQYIEEKKLNFG
jgi:hypothetical protein